MIRFDEKKTISMRYFILFSLFLTVNLSAQTWTELANMPEPVANNAVTQATVNGKLFLTFLMLWEGKLQQEQAPLKIKFT